MYIWMSSSQKPSEVAIVVKNAIFSADMPVSSSSSRSAHSSGSSPGASLPAGISTVTRPSAVRYWRTRQMRPSSVSATGGALEEQ